MITASIVTYIVSKDIDKENELKTSIKCACSGIIEKVFIVDNSPTNFLKSIIEAQSDKIIYIFNNKNLGYGAGHNIAIRYAINIKSNYHVVLNPDILFENDTIIYLNKFMDNNQNVGQVLPKVLYPNGELQYLCKLVPTPFDLIFKRFLPNKMTEKRMRKFQLQFTGYNKIMNIPYLSGCFMFFRISALKEIGLFDERFFMYPEDIDITRRMHEKYDTIFNPHITIIHAHAADSYRSKKMLWVHVINMIRYFNKWGWIFDEKRKVINKKVLKELNYKI